MFGGIYDDPVNEDDKHNNKNIYGFTSYDENTHRGTMYINVSDYDKWLYISLKNKTFDTVFIPQSLTQDWDGKSGIHYHYVKGSQFTLDSIVKTNKQTDPKTWDIALHRFEAKVNGGAFETSFTSTDQLPVTSESFDDIIYTEDEWIDTLVMTDRNGMLNYYIGYQNIMCNKVLSNWLRMDISNPPPTYHPSDKVYILRFEDNTKAALHFDNYLSPSGITAFVTVSFIYPY